MLTVAQRIPAIRPPEPITLDSIPKDEPGLIPEEPAANIPPEIDITKPKPRPRPRKPAELVKDATNGDTTIAKVAAPKILIEPANLPDSGSTISAGIARGETAHDRLHDSPTAGSDKKQRGGNVSRGASIPGGWQRGGREAHCRADCNRA